ncbi:MAG TPA: TonB family protein [Dokdonella sp.]
MSTEWFAALATMTLSGSLAVLGVLALRVPIRRGFGAQIAYAMWIAVPLVVCAVLLPAPAQPVAAFMQIAHVGAPAQVVAGRVDEALDPRVLLLGVWLMGVILSAAWFVAQQRRYLRSLGRLSVVGEGGDRRVVRSEFDVDGPALVGAWRPRIVLPGDFEQRYAAGERELILAHERVHMTRGDARINAFVVALRCLNWFNPVLHLAAAKFRLDQELACDAAVIARFPEARRPYADAMLKVQLAGQPRQELRLPAGCRWPSGHPLKERIAMLKQPLPTRARRASGIAVVAAAIACGSFASWAAQPARPEAGATVSDSAASEDVSFRRMLPPAYPPSAVVARISGNVMLNVHVDAQGNPESAAVDSVEPPEAAMLSDAAIAAVMRWKFNPALRDGVAVADDVQVPVEFRVDEDEASAGAAQPTPAKASTTIAASYQRLSPPAYPASSVASGIEGVVYVAAAIDADGHVASASVEHAEPVMAGVLGDAATTAVRSWTFNPARQNGNTVASRIVVPLRFALSDPKTVPMGALPANALEVIDVVAHPKAEDATANAPPPPPPPPPPLPPPPSPPGANGSAS